MKRTWIHHAIIVNEGRRFAGSVVIEGEKIQEVIEGDGKPDADCEEEIDAQGCFLLPGVIDDHVHFRDPGLTHKADMATETGCGCGWRSNFVHGYAELQPSDYHTRSTGQ